MMTAWQAIETRISCRAYGERAIEADTLQCLRTKIDELNAQSGLRMVLVTPDQGGEALGLAPAMFSGTVRTYLAMIAKTSDLNAEKMGYYGEKVVL